MPSCFCSAFSSSCICSLSLRSSAPSGSSRSSTFGLVHQRAGERDALALAAGKLRRAAALIAAELDHGERGSRLALALRLGDALDHQAVGDVLADRHMRKEGVVLEHRVDVALVGRNAFGGLAENLDMPFVGLLEAGNEAQARRLARAGRPEHGEELAFRDVEGHVIDGADRAEVAASTLTET